MIHVDFLLTTRICLSGACVLIHSIRQSFHAIMAAIVPRFLLQILEEFTLIETFHNDNVLELFVRHSDHIEPFVSYKQAHDH